MADIIQIRRDTASNWTSANPILTQGELGAETDTNKIKIGDGTTAWSSLAYLIDAGDYLTATSTNTLTNKTIAYADNTLTGVVPTSAIGVSVQAYDATLLNDSDIGVNVQAYDATILVDADIGVNVQAYDADTAKYDDATANFTGTLQQNSVNVITDAELTRPDIRPSLNLDFANTKRLDPRITFTRASTATYYGTQTAKAEENLLLYSENFTNGWPVSNVTKTENSTTAPDGTTTADTITDNATNASHRVYQNISIATNTTYVFSCWLKAGTGNYAYLTILDDAISQRYFAADFNLSTGTVRTSGAGTSGTLTSASITESPIGSGWYRCVIIGQVAAVSSATRASFGVSDGTTAFNAFGNILYVGTGSTIYAWGAQLEQRSAVTAYTPTTTQAITNYIPVLETAASGVARFDHNPTTGESLGLLIEEGRTNVLTYSEQFDNAAWTKVQSSITANTIVAPDGALTGDKLVENTATADHAFRGDGTISAGATISFSIYAKAAERTNIRLQFADTTSTNQTLAFFNLSDGTTSGLSQTGASTLGVASITAVGNGWYRCVLTGLIDGSATTARCRVSLSDASNNISYTGDGYSGIYIWGAQLEAGAFLTSYIPTVASQVTRAADAANMTGTNFSSWYRADEGSFYIETDPVSGSLTEDGAFRRLFAVSDGTNDNHVSLIGVGSSDLLRFERLVGGTFTSLTAPASPTGSFKYSVALASGDQQTYINGTASASNTVSGTFPVVSQFNIGSAGAGGSNMAGTIRKIAYYPSRLTNAQLQALTS